MIYFTSLIYKKSEIKNHIVIYSNLCNFFLINNIKIIDYSTYSNDEEVYIDTERISSNSKENGENSENIKHDSNNNNDNSGNDEGNSVNRNYYKI